jgi:hypothetical protein
MTVTPLRSARSAAGHCAPKALKQPKPEEGPAPLVPSLPMKALIPAD